MSQSPRSILNAQFEQLKQERSSFMPHYRDLSDFYLPRRGRWLSDNGNANRGDRRNGKLVDPHPRLAARTLASGMMAGMTSPARPWFEVAASDPSLRTRASVKRWTEIVTTRMRQVFASSNIYNALHTLYLELGVFGTAPMLVDEDKDDVIRAYPFTVGSYVIGQDGRLRVDTFMREFQMTALQMMSQFGKGKLSKQTIALLNANQGRQWIPVRHACMPNYDRSMSELGHRSMPWRDVYYETNADEDLWLQESGYYEFPIMCPRWDVTAEDVLGTSPGMDGLGISKALQLQTKRKAQAIDKHVDPPMNVPPSLRNIGASLLPGAMNVRESMGDHSGVEPVFVMKPEISALLGDIQDMRQQISRCMFEDLFLMLANSDRAQITAREIEERHAEKLLMLGPVLERLNDELLDPLIDRTFNIMLRKGLIPTPPQELQGNKLKIEYVSILAQAQRAVASSSIERFTGFVSTLVPVFPSITDKVDIDAIVDEYGEAVGVPSKCIVSEDEVAAARQKRAQQERMQQMAANAQPALQAAQATKALADSPVGGDQSTSVLDRLLGSVG